jgi:pimeloyl-ACP methyl ester carboxylesterase
MDRPSNMYRVREVGFLAAALFLSTGVHGYPADVLPGTEHRATVAVFQPGQGNLPFPNDLFFAGSTDGTINIQSEKGLTPIQTAINTLDGFSTTAPIRASFGAPVDPNSFTAKSVIVLQVTIDNTTKLTTGMVRPLTFGVDYTTGLGPEADIGNTILEIRPKRPLVPSTGATNNGYLVLLTNGIRDAEGKAVRADKDYARIKAALPNCSAVEHTSLDGICHSIGAQLRLARYAGIDASDVVLSFSFSTQSISDTLGVIDETATATRLTVRDTGQTSAQLGAQLDPRVQFPGHANVFVGTLSIPYYLSRQQPLTGFWQGNPSPLDARSRFLTRFNPAPVPTEMLQIPVLVTVPNARSTAGAAKPPGGWPAVIFEHGTGRSRLDVLALADTFADSGFVVVAIDLPLHGITDPKSQLFASAANPLYAGLSLPATGSIERTFDLDLVNNSTGAPGPDGQIDPSGSHYVNPASALTTRDNLREGAADLIALTRSLPNMNLDNDPAGDINPARIHHFGVSLGGIVGGVYMGVTSQTEVGTATLGMAGGGLTSLLRDSPALSPALIAALEAQGLKQGTTQFEQFLRDLQTVADPGDPLNYIAAAATNHPIHLIQVVGSASSPPDQVVPNSATQRLIDAAALTKIPAPAAPGPVTDADGFRAHIDFVIGGHRSLLDPSVSPAATAEMQVEAITFTGAPVPPMPRLSFPGFPATNPGSTILILDPAAIQM